MLERKMQAIKNDIQQAEHAINRVYYKVDNWARYAAEVGIKNMTDDELNQLAGALNFIKETLEPYRN